MLGYTAKGHQGCRWIKVGFNYETLLDYLDRPSVITKALKRGREGQALEVRVMQCEKNSVHIAGFEDGEGGHTQGMQTASRHWTRQGNEFSPRASRKEYSPANTSSRESMADL